MVDILSSKDYDPNAIGSVLKRLADTLNGAALTDVKPSTRAPSAAAASQGNWGDITTAFVGDFSKCNFPLSYSITGSASLGQPTNTYRNNPELSPFAVYLRNGSGFNSGTAGTGPGRTACAAFNVKVDNYGQGDCVAYTASGFVSGAKPGATNFLANPAVSLFNGGTYAGAAGVYLNPVEINCNDQGFDCAAVNFVANQFRTVNTAALGVYWNGYRSQSKGSVAIDSHFFGSGLTVNGLDFSTSTISGQVFKLASGNRPTITGSRGGNAALASLLTALATLGLVTDSTTA